MPASECSTCGAQLLWVTSPAGKNLPVDAIAKALVPVAPGVTRGVTAYSLDYATEPPQAKAIAGKWVMVESSPYTRPGYVSHFATCTHPERYSGRRK